MKREQVKKLFESLFEPNEEGNFSQSLHDMKIRDLFSVLKVREEGIAFSFLQDYIATIPTRNLSDEAKSILFAHMLAFIPFFLPLEQKNISLQMLDGQIRKYHIKRFNLSPLPTSPYDVISLEPQEKDHDSIMVFSGTTPPPYESFQITNIANVFPTRSPGGLLTFGHRGLQNWAKDQTSLKLYGISLGGGVALAWASKLSKLANVVETSVINPALPHTSIECDGNINIYINSEDWVASLGGLVPNQSNIYRITPTILPTSFLGRFVLTHSQPFIASHTTKIENLTTAEFNQHNRPIWWMMLLYITRLIASIVLIPLLIIYTIIRAIIIVLCYPFSQSKNIPQPDLVQDQTVSKDLKPTTEPTSSTEVKPNKDPSTAAPLSDIRIDK